MICNSASEAFIRTRNDHIICNSPSEVSRVRADGHKHWTKFGNKQWTEFGDNFNRDV